MIRILLGSLLVGVAVLAVPLVAGLSLLESLTAATVIVGFLTLAVSGIALITNGLER